MAAVPLAEALCVMPERVAANRRHRAAARAILPYGEPESWLDVGTGYGRFPRAAREFFPYTAFDGLDTTARVADARATGRVEEAHQGLLTDPDVAARLRGRYDVVSMLGHLSRVPDPGTELAAVLDVLRPGGHLLLELPAPDCLFARLLGRYWPWHGRLASLPPEVLHAQLAGLGCVVVRVDRHAAHVPYDLAGAVRALLGHRRTPTVLALLPIGAAVVDHLLAPVLSRTGFANTYRVVARRTKSQGSEQRGLDAREPSG